MLVFGIDTCCASATAGVVSEEKMVLQTVVCNKKTHSQKMMPQIVNMLENGNIALEEIDAFAAAVGPGSFTGVRIGVATVKGFAQALNKPCVAVSTLEALALGCANFDGIICPILDARRGQVYNAKFRGRERLCEDRALSIDELLEELKGEKVIFMGDGVFVHREKIEEVLGNDAHFAPKILLMNLGGAVAEIGMEKLLKGETTEYKDLVPSYVRLSQAEQTAQEESL